MSNNEQILVIGHRNPDMDAIGAAVGYAWVLNKRTPNAYQAGRTGDINSQTAFALDHFKVAAPPLVSDVAPRVGALVKTVSPLSANATIGDAFKASNTNLLPITDGNKALGIVLGSAIVSAVGNAVTHPATLAEALNQPLQPLINTTSLVLKSDDLIRDVMGQVYRADQDEFLVVNQDGNYVGVVRKAALLAPIRRQVVLVDHNEPGQAVPGIEEAEIIEVLDHHRLGNLPTLVPIRFQAEPVGCTSTLVAEHGFANGGTIDAGIAGVLLSAILSDTLVFRSPTLTDRDRVMAYQLAKAAGLAAATASDEETLAAINEFGSLLLAAGAGLGDRTSDDIVNSDLKFYEANGLKAGVSQVEIANMAEVEPRLPSLHAALENMTKQHGLALALLMVTDVVKGNSRLVVAGQARVIDLLPFSRLDAYSLDAPSVVSRKKQMLPPILDALGKA